MTHPNWCGKDCNNCNTHCKLDESIPCSPNCDGLNSKTGEPDGLNCNTCDAYLMNYNIELKITKDKKFDSGVKCPVCGKNIMLAMHDKNDCLCSGSIIRKNNSFEWKTDDENIEAGLYADCECKSWFEIDDENKILYSPNPIKTNNDYYRYISGDYWLKIKDI